MEYKTKINKEAFSDKKNVKNCDLWFDDNNQNTHYIELKVIFNNNNLHKMARQAAHDYWYMIRIDKEENPFSGSVVIVGMKFKTDEQWQGALSKFRVEAGEGESMKPSFDDFLAGSGEIRICIFTKNYEP